MKKQGGFAVLREDGAPFGITVALEPEPDLDSAMNTFNLPGYISLASPSRPHYLVEITSFQAPLERGDDKRHITQRWAIARAWKLTFVGDHWEKSQEMASFPETYGYSPLERGE